jgi:hypothetical protein
MDFVYCRNEDFLLEPQQKPKTRRADDGRRHGKTAGWLGAILESIVGYNSKNTKQ